MLDKQDLEQISVVVKEAVSTTFDEKFKPAFDAAFKSAFDAAFKPAFDAAFKPAFEAAFTPAFNAAFRPAFDAAFKPAFDKAFLEKFGDVWKFNLEPAFDYVHERIDKLQVWVVNLDGKISQLPTKLYIDDKIAGLRTEWKKDHKKY